MSIPVPLAVRLLSASDSRYVTADIRDLTLRWTDPGGYASCQISLARPLAADPREIAYYGTLTVYDARTGLVAFEGRLEDPGRHSGNDGQVWDLAAVGGQAHTFDVTQPLIYVDQPMSSLERVDNFTPAGSDTVGADPGDSSGVNQALVLQFPNGISVGPNARIVMRYLGLQRSGQKLAHVDYSWDAGHTNAFFQSQAIARTNGSTANGDIARTNSWDIVGGSLSPLRIVTHWAAGRNTVEWRAIYTGSGGPITNEVHWNSFSNLIVLATRYTADGVEQLTAAPYANNFVLAHEVVADLLGRMLPEYDGVSASITTTTYPIDQLAYPDGTTANGVLSDLMTLQAGYTWRVWERDPLTNRYRFEWTSIPTTVRYEADVIDGYDSTGSADGLYNSVSVRWRDAKDKTQITTVFGSSPTLTAAGLNRRGQIDLGDEIGSAAAATQAGQEWLADRAAPANAGRLRIARRIHDIQAGRMVEPWEIRPGLIRIRGILPRQDAVNASTRDGTTIFRIVGCEYSVSDSAATLELDSYPPSMAQTIARLQQAAARPGIRRHWATASSSRR